MCREANHVPLRCEEVKLLEDGKRRTEEHMAASVIRECANKRCGTRFVKETGCNMMTCPKCGDKMCYLCRAPVRDHSHFYGQGGEPSQERPCPLGIMTPQETAAMHDREAAMAEQEAATAEQEAKGEPAAKRIRLQ